MHKLCTKSFHGTVKNKIEEEEEGIREIEGGKHIDGVPHQHLAQWEVTIITRCLDALTGSLRSASRSRRRTLGRRSGGTPMARRT